MLRAAPKLAQQVAESPFAPSQHAPEEDVLPQCYLPRFLWCAHLCACPSSDHMNETLLGWVKQLAWFYGISTLQNAHFTHLPEKKKLLSFISLVLCVSQDFSLYMTISRWLSRCRASINVFLISHVCKKKSSHHKKMFCVQTSIHKVFLAQNSCDVQLWGLGGIHHHTEWGLLNYKLFTLSIFKIS